MDCSVAVPAKEYEVVERCDAYLIIGTLIERYAVVRFD